MQRGGIAFIWKDRLRYRERDDLTCWIEGKIETVAIKVQLENKTFCFAWCTGLLVLFWSSSEILNVL